MQEKLTKADILASQVTHEIDTMYGRRVSIRRLTTGFVTRTQLLFTPPVETKPGVFKDALGIGFLDAECPACGAAAKTACERFCDEVVPHEGRVSAAHADRVSRGNRGALRASIVDPEVDESFLVFLERDPAAMFDLITQIIQFNGLDPASRTEAAATFREGVQGSPEIPTAG